MSDQGEFVQVGTWLLPEAYGHTYDHFTQTRMATVPGRCIAVFARASDLEGTPYAGLLAEGAESASGE